MEIKPETDIKKQIQQMFILGMDGTNLYDNKNLVEALHEGLGGVIFFTQNIQTISQFKELISNIKKEAKTSSIYSPLLSIDQEGGRVERTENIFNGKKYLSAKFAAEKGTSFLQNQTEQIAQLLKDFGINLNFAPCLDVNTNPNNPIIGERAFSNNTDEVIKYGNIVAQTYLKNDIIPCSKHFPGHGDANADSHKTLPVIDLPFEEMEKHHIKPFKEVPVPMIMVAHLYCKAFDNEEIPSSLSPNIINYLRKGLNYDGLIITDDMVMEGVKTSVKENTELNIDSQTNAAMKTIKAGANILLYRNSYDETIKIINNLVRLSKQDDKLLQNIQISYKKIIEFKSKYLK